MRSQYRSQENAVIVLFFMTAMLFAYDASAQSYQFNFYNGDVTQADGQVEQHVPKEAGSAAAPPVAPVANPQPTPEMKTLETKPQDPEKLKRTGLSMMAGYSQSYMLDSHEFMSDMRVQTFRGGLSFISSYDFSLDVEYLGNKVSGDLLMDGVKEAVSGDASGLSVGVRNQYWLSDSVALSLGVSTRGSRGTLSGTQDYRYASYGGGLNVGPTFQLGKFQLQLSYEYGLDNIIVEAKKDSDFKDSKWTQSSAFRGLVSYRF
jgi:hypothetical protein